MARSVFTKDDDILADEIAKFYSDPLGYVMFMFPWDDPGSGINLVKLPEKYRKRFPNVEHGPDEWACEFLDELGVEIKVRGFDGVNAVDPIRFTTSSGHGIGKSTLVAWLIKFIMDTRPLSKGTVTAVTADQLQSKTWAELGKWNRMSLTAHWYDYSNTRGNMLLRHRLRPEEWICRAITCKEENSESFQGQHAAGGTSFYIFDEASGIPEPIFAARDGGLTDGEPMVFDFGNPTRNSGRFFENCQGKFQHNFIVRKIDSRSVALPNKRYLQQIVDDYGEDNDTTRVRVRGEFPLKGSVEFIGIDKVERAMEREIVYDRSAQLVIGVDPAAYGDDETVIYPRIGSDARSWAPMTQKGRYKNLDGEQIKDKVIALCLEFEALGKTPAAIFIDRTGIGQSAYDFLKKTRFNVIGVHFGNAAIDNKTYRYRPDEMWGTLADAIDKNLCLPNDRSNRTTQDLKDQLTQRWYSFTQSNQIHLEPKKDMKKRGLVSPDLADALALTYAQDVAGLGSGNVSNDQAKPVFAQHDFDPYVVDMKN